MRLAVQSPVEVSFLPVVDVAQQVAEKIVEEKPESVKQAIPKPRKKFVKKPKPKTKPKIEKKTVVEAPFAEPDGVELVEEDSDVAELTTEVPVEDGNAAVEPVVVKNSVTDEKSSDISYGAVVEAVPRYSSNPLPEYPYQARQRHWEGVVWLLVDVAADGSVDDLFVEESSGYKILDRAATRTVSRWSFEPATRAGIPVSSKARIPVRFRLEGR